jgi:EpsI family protein
MTLQPFVIRNLVLMSLMLVASIVAGVMRPSISLADEMPPIDLETMVPREFGDWRELRNTSTQLVNPQQRRQLELIYSQTLSRVYTNSGGYRIMLSIAYGRDQKDTSQLHRPDLCYPAQGFQILGAREVVLALPGNELATRMLDTRMGERVEPLTYWTVVGEHVTTTGLDKKLAEMRYGLQGRIADGMIVRVSSIDRDSAQAYAEQAHFAADLVAAIAPEHRSRFAGSTLTLNKSAQP